MKKILFFIAFILAALVSEGKEDNKYSTNIKNLTEGKQTLLVGHLYYPPFYLYEGKKLTGMDAEIIRAIALRANIKKVQFVFFKNLKELKAALKVGKIDVIANGIVKSPLNNREFFMTEPYYIRGGLGFLYVAGKMEYTKPSDLRNLKLGVLDGSYPQLEWLPSQGINSNFIVSYQTGKDLVNGLKSGEIDIVITNYTFCRYQEVLYDHRLESILVDPMPIAFLLRSQNFALLNEMNRAIKEMWADGSLYKIKKSYLQPIGIEPSLFE